MFKILSHKVHTKIFVLLLLITATTVANAKPKTYSEQDFRRWGSLANELMAAGLDSQKTIKLLQDPRLPKFEEYTFNLIPKEPVNIYAGFVTPKNIKKGLDFLRTHQKTFKKIQSEFRIEPAIITAIVLVETDFGKNTGKHRILYRLARLANCTDKINVSKNYQRLKKEDPQIKYEDVMERAKKIQAIFLPEIFSLLEICENRCDPYNVFGSGAGAFGIPQFLPSSFLKHAIDYNQDGTTSLFQIEDSLASVANYFRNHGWLYAQTDQEKKDVIWHYNRSQPYVDTVLQLYKEFIKANY